MVQVPSGQRVNVQLPAVRTLCIALYLYAKRRVFPHMGRARCQGAAPGMRMRVAVPTAPHGVSLPPMDAVAKLLGERGKGVRSPCDKHANHQSHASVCLQFHEKVEKLRRIIQTQKLSATGPPQHLVLNVRRDRILVSGVKEQRAALQQA